MNRKLAMDHIFPQTVTLLDDAPHGLLEPPKPQYSQATLRRAYITWLYCGQQNEYPDVCKYYHYLEEAEKKLPPHERIISQQHEMSLYNNSPPKSAFLNHHYPQLYTQTYFEPQYLRKIEAIKNECVVNIDGFEMKGSGVTQHEIVKASLIIKKYCVMQKIPLKDFLVEFKEYTDRCTLQNTINNVECYIKKKMVHTELLMLANDPKNFNNTNDFNGNCDKVNGNNVRLDKPTCSGIERKITNIATKHKSQIKLGKLTTDVLIDNSIEHEDSFKSIESDVSFKSINDTDADSKVADIRAAKKNEVNDNGDASLKIINTGN